MAAALAKKQTLSLTKAAQPAKVSRSRLVCRADGGFIGSSTNLIMVASTTAFLAAGKFGLAPTVKRGTDAACKLQDRPNAAGLISNDPTGFTAVDTLAFGALGHMAGVGIVMGLRATGGL
ncbi:polypeptide 37 precursor [Scenedesmus sp. NREL 46B-D3]|nr:polypeptide 37 precursor [Scenedesmus sp. NREL 46B-D3]